MYLKIKEITSVVNQITDLIGDNKKAPGIMLVVEDSKLNVRYNEPTKAFTSPIEVRLEETDVTNCVVKYEQFCRAIANCQPSGSIKVDEIRLEFKGNRIEVTAEQKSAVGTDYDEAGNEVTVYKVLSKKKMDINWEVPGASLQTQILTRMNYADIFECNGNPIERTELASMLSKLIVEKGKTIYFSPKGRCAFVNNTAYLVAVPYSDLEVTVSDANALRERLEASGQLDRYDLEYEMLKNKITSAIVVNTGMAKAILGILQKSTCENVIVASRTIGDGNASFCSIYADDESFGVWFKMDVGSNTGVMAFGSYNALAYNTYQLSLAKEFLADNLKSALSTTAIDKTTVKFADSKLEAGKKELQIIASNSVAAVNDDYAIVIDSVSGDLTALDSVVLTLSLKTLYDMVNQVSSSMVAIDLQINETGTYIRVAELDGEKFRAAYMRKCDEIGVMPGNLDESLIPTFRTETLGCKMYCMV